MENKTMRVIDEFLRVNRGNEFEPILKLLKKAVQESQDETDLDWVITQIQNKIMIREFKNERGANSLTTPQAMAIKETISELI